MSALTLTNIALLFLVAMICGACAISIGFHAKKIKDLNVVADRNGCPAAGNWIQFKLGHPLQCPVIDEWVLWSFEVSGSSRERAVFCGFMNKAPNDKGALRYFVCLDGGTILYFLDELRDVYFARVNRNVPQG